MKQKACRAFEDLLALDVFGDLSPDEAARVQAHLRGCTACREERSSLAQARAELDAPAAAASELEAVWAGLRERAVAPWRPSRGRPRMLFAARMAAAVLLAAAGFVAGRAGDPGRPRQVTLFPTQAELAAAERRGAEGKLTGLASGEDLRALLLALDPALPASERAGDEHLRVAERVAAGLLALRGDADVRTGVASCLAADASVARGELEAARSALEPVATGPATSPATWMARRRLAALAERPETEPGRGAADLEALLALGPEKAEGARAALALGRCRARSGDLLGALDAFRRAEEGGGPAEVAAQSTAARAETLESLADWRGALEAWRAVAGSAAVGDEARELRDLASARIALLDGGESDGWRSYASYREAARLRGTAAEADALEQVLANHPESPAAEAAFEDLRRLRGVTTGADPARASRCAAEARIDRLRSVAGHDARIAPFVSLRVGQILERDLRDPVEAAEEYRRAASAPWPTRTVALARERLAALSR